METENTEDELGCGWQIVIVVIGILALLGKLAWWIATIFLAALAFI